MQRLCGARLEHHFNQSLAHEDQAPASPDLARAARRAEVEIVGVDRVMVGTDFPFDMGEDDPLGLLAQVEGLTDRANVNDDIRLVAIRGIGRTYATSQDAAFLRQLYSKYPSLAIKESVINSVTDVGGRDNIQFVMNIAGIST